jgi:hypothetical protein
MLYDGTHEAFGFCDGDGSWRQEGNNITVSISVLGMECTIFDIKESP